jgi:hypothetical protein
MTKNGAILLIHTKMVETTIYFCVSNILRIFLQMELF